MPLPPLHIHTLVIIPSRSPSLLRTSLRQLLAHSVALSHSLITHSLTYHSLTHSLTIHHGQPWTVWARSWTTASVSRQARTARWRYRAGPESRSRRTGRLGVQLGVAVTWMGLMEALAMSGTSLTATGRGFHPQGVSATTQRGKGLCSGSRKRERNCVHDHRLLPRCIDAHPMVVSKHCVLIVLVCCVVRESMVGCRNAGDVYVTHAYARC